MLDYRAFLRQELERRQTSNPRYSLRAFARSLELDPTYLSRVLAGTRLLSISAAQKIARALNTSDGETKLLVEAAASSAMAKRLRRLDVRSEGETQSVVTEIDSDQYVFISDMLHYLLLEATCLDGFQSDARWLARRFGRTVMEVEYALARLIRLGLLSSASQGFAKTNRHLMTKDVAKTTPALKASQRQILNSALKALKDDSIDRRSATGMTMAIDPEKIPLAKSMIADFTQKLCEVLESGSRKEVYQLSVNLFSLEKHLAPSKVAE